MICIIHCSGINMRFCSQWCVFPCLVMSSLHPNLGLGQGQDCTVGPVLVNGHSPALFSSIQHVDMLLFWWLGECMRMLHWPDQSPPEAGTTVLQAVDDDTWALATHTGINTQMLTKEGVKVKCVITYSLLDNILFLFHLIDISFILCSYYNSALLSSFGCFFWPIQYH